MILNYFKATDTNKANDDYDNDDKIMTLLMLLMAKLVSKHLNTAAHEQETKICNYWGKRHASRTDVMKSHFRNQVTQFVICNASVTAFCGGIGIGLISLLPVSCGVAYSLRRAERSHTAVSNLLVSYKKKVIICYNYMYV